MTRRFLNRNSMTLRESVYRGSTSDASTAQIECHAEIRSSSICSSSCGDGKGKDMTLAYISFVIK